ncbi:SAP30-binding protein isoform X2 [Takifugu rubripes]|uniref:SAP30-binding protein isoform X2 n=1 Tax=Takifugu rubripes TaxID=31033 RepID=UPI0005D18828|nr:SAP30-binding protein isoform X2 [Takifugu rubripes]XP_011616823.1 SAP30-binding protein isoform X2 [Takifugu rubripes]XP_029692165.1 SAP30-binding protein isoform X2 [Takifugu rubripes]|eukprot:XP_011616822.1 PREDICTED: SAP30-binding protein isoform X2 [Takifugu rubripes]
MDVKQEIMDIIQKVWTKLQALPQAKPLEIGTFAVVILFMGPGGSLVYSYGDDDLNRTEGPDEKESGDEESRESNSEMDESEEGRDTDDVEIPEEEKKDPSELVALFSEKVRNMSPDEIRIPPEPPGRCSSQLQEKINKLFERKTYEDFDTNNHIQKKKEFRNPSIYEKLIQFCQIDELGTNYPNDMFDPHGWSEDSYYESLAKAQKVEMDKLEKAKKERTKIEFVTGTKKGTNPSSTAASTASSTSTTTATDAQKRKSKWDSAIPVTLAQPTIITTTATLPAVVSVTTTATGTKTTVISAVGTILKKAKQ